MGRQVVVVALRPPHLGDAVVERVEVGRVLVLWRVLVLVLPLSAIPQLLHPKRCDLWSTIHAPRLFVDYNKIFRNYLRSLITTSNDRYNLKVLDDNRLYWNYGNISGKYLWIIQKHYTVNNKDYSCRIDITLERLVLNGLCDAIDHSILILCWRFTNMWGDL